MKISTDSDTFYKITENSPVLYLQEILITSDVYKFGKHQYFKIRINEKYIKQIENIEKEISNLLDKDIITQLYVNNQLGYMTVKIPIYIDKINILNNSQLKTVLDITKNSIVDLKISFNTLYNKKNRIQYRWNLHEIAFEKK